MITLNNFLNIMKYTPGEEKTIYRQETKARKLIRDKCIIKVSKTQYIIKPIKDYNKTTYKVEYLNGWKCNCQFCKMMNKECSHIRAVKKLIESKLE